MQDRAKLNNGKSCKLMCPQDFNPSDFSAFITALKAGNVYVDVIPNNDLDNNAGVSVVGTALNKANLLTDSTATKFGYQATDNPTPNDILSKIGDLNATTECELTVAGWTTSGSLWVQTKLIEGISTAVEPNIKGIIYPTGCTDSNRRAIQRSASYITSIDTANGSITFTATIKPTVAIKFGIGV